MKKKYSKPRIFIERFSLSNSISAGCELDTAHPSYEENCGYPIRGGIVFVENTQCDTYTYSGITDTFCYHVPYETNNLFNS